jgi:hypothetical protein
LWSAARDAARKADLSRILLTGISPIVPFAVLCRFRRTKTEMRTSPGIAKDGRVSGRAALFYSRLRLEMV